MLTRRRRRSPGRARSSPGAPLRTARTGPPGGGCPVAGRCCRCSSSRRCCRSGWSGPTRRSRTRAWICGPGTCSGRTGCMARRSRRSRTTSPVRPSSTRRSARSRTGRAAWPGPGSCRWCSCSGRPPCCGARPGGGSAGARRSSLPRCSPCWAPPFTWARSPPTTRWPCSSWPSRPGACSAPGTAVTCRAAWSQQAWPWPWPTPRHTPRSCSTCSCWCWWCWPRSRRRAAGSRSGAWSSCWSRSSPAWPRVC